MELDNNSKKNLSLLIKHIKGDLTLDKLSGLTGLTRSSLNGWARGVVGGINDAHIATIANYIGSKQSAVEKWLLTEFRTQHEALIELRKTSTDKTINFKEMRENLSAFFYKASVIEIEEIIKEGVKHLSTRALGLSENDRDKNYQNTKVEVMFFAEEIDWETLGEKARNRLLSLIKFSLPKEINKKDGEEAAKYFGISPSLFWGLWDESAISPLNANDMEKIARKCRKVKKWTGSTPTLATGYYSSWDELLHDLQNSSATSAKAANSK